MDENGIHLQIDVPDTDVLTVKDENGFIRIEKEKVDKFEETDFLSFNDFSQLTFFHPSELDLGEPFDNVSDKQDALKSESGIEEESLSSLQKISDVLFETPLETATAFQDTSTIALDFGNTTSNTTAFQEGALNMSFFSNSSNSDWSAEEIGAVFIVCLMVPFIILSNIFVIISVIRFRRLHTPTNYFITSLAAVDIVVALATPLAIAVQLFQYGGGDAGHDTLLCLLPNRILMMACGVSLLTLATIAYDRHTALICPLEYVNIMTSRKVAIMMAVSWIYSSAVVWFPIAAGWYDVMSPSVRCSADHLHPKVHIFFFLAVFIPSCTVILICYSRIFLVARHHAKAIAAVEFAVHRHLQVRFMIKDTKYAKTLALVIGAFLLLWLPHLIFTFIKTFDHVSISIWWETYLILLAVFNSGLNPWIYAFKNNEFRAAFKRMAKEYCSETFCKLDERRSSLMSGISITPRLSRTDSRMVSTILEQTKDYHGNDKLRRSLDSLDNYEIEVEQAKTKVIESEFSEIESNNNNNNKCDTIPHLSVDNETKQRETMAGHINWGHQTTDEQVVPSEKDNINSELSRKNTVTSVSRNQSFTLGFNHVCSSREFQKDYNEQLCKCRHASSFPAPKITRSSSSVTHSSFLPYVNNRGAGDLKLPSPLKLQISRLQSPSTSSLFESTALQLPFDSSFAPLPSPLPSPRSPERAQMSHKSRPRPSRGLNKQRLDNSSHVCTVTSSNSLLNDNSFAHAGAPHIHSNDSHFLCYPCIDQTTLTSIITQSPTQSRPTFGQSAPATSTNLCQTKDGRPDIIACSLPMGQPSASGSPCHAP